MQQEDVKHLQHSDVVLGALIVNDKELSKQLYFIQNASGASGLSTN